MKPNRSLLYCNGIDGTSGAVKNIPLAELWAGLVRVAPPANCDELRQRRHQDDSRPEAVDSLKQRLAAWQAMLVVCPPGPDRDELTAKLAQGQAELLRRHHLGVKEGIDPLDLQQAGWGLIFPSSKAGSAERISSSAILEALSPLIQLRQKQAGARFRILSGPDGVRPGEQKKDFLRRHRCASSGPILPESMPYYLLLVGCPEEIPFSFQQQLDVQYAVGRIHFDSVQEYANYAKGVVSAEMERLRKQSLRLFGITLPGDYASEFSQRALVAPLDAALRNSLPSSDIAPRQTSEDAGWTVDTIAPEQATQAALLRQLGGDETPAILFSCSHGLVLPLGHTSQYARQGSLICRDFPLKFSGELPEQFIVSGEHIPDAADVRGLVLFSFACFSAGTPSLDSFPQRGRPKVAPNRLAERDFLAALPQRLLGHPGGGALAVIGHVDRAWGYSFCGPGETKTSSTEAFHSTLLRLAHGQPVGHAMDYFNQRYAELATELVDQLDRLADEEDEELMWELSELWTAMADARSYIVLGDPAARVTAAKPREPFLIN